MLKLYPSWFVFFTTIMVGVFLVLSRDNWFVMWIGFELSLLGFIPMFSGTSLVVEGIIKYFLSQAGGSSLFMFSFMLFSDVYSVVLFFLGIAIKIGVFPFYHWVPMVISSLSWGGCLLLSTVQKLPTLIVLFGQRESCFFFILLSGAISVVFRGILGYNQTYMRSLIGYSSISHTGWLLCASVLGLNLVVAYLFVYYYLTIVLFVVFGNSNVVKIVGGVKGYKDLFFTNLLILTLAGIPPFSIFFLKVYVIFGLTSFVLVVISLVLGAILSIYYYLTFVIPSVSSFWVRQLVETFGLVKLSAFVISIIFPFLFVL